MTEGDRIQQLDRKIAKTEANSKELQREIRMLKKLSHDKGNELVDLDIRDEYPEKIRQLLEEIRWARDRHSEMTEKLSVEEKQSKRQREHVHNLEDNCRELDIRYRKHAREIGAMKKEQQLMDEGE